MTARTPLPDDLTSEFTVAVARDHGVSRQRLFRRDLVAPFRGVRAVGRDLDLVSRCRALALVLPEGAAFCGVTAATLLDLPLPRLTDDRIRVSALSPTRAIRHQGTVGSQRSSGSVVLVRGLPLLSPEDTFISLARELSLHDLTAVADRLISGTLRDPALSRRTRLEAAVTRHGSGAHARKLRTSVANARERVWSRPETLVRLLAVAAGLPEPIPNFKIAVAGGEAILDLAWPEFRVASEYDGRWHDKTPEQWAADAGRRELVKDAGWDEVHVRATELFGAPEVIVGRLVRRLAAAGFTPDRPLEMTRLPRYAP